MKFRRSTLSYISCAALLTAAFAACNPETEQRASDLTFDRLHSNVAYTLEGSASAYAADSDLTFANEIKVLLPTAIYGNDITEFRDSILKLAFDTVGTDYPAIMDRYEEKTVTEVGFPYTKIATDSDSIGEFLAQFDGYSSVEGNVVTMTPDMMSYQLILSEYPMRAAHGDYTIHYINYDMNKGKIVALTDLFTPEGIEALPRILRQRARSVISIIGPTTLEALPAENNYFINNRGDIVFAYQPYEIASYAQGAVQVKLAPYLVEEYLTDYGKNLLLK